MSTPDSTRDLVIRLATQMEAQQEKFTKLERDMDERFTRVEASIDAQGKKISAIFDVFNQARGARWAVLAVAALLGAVGVKLVDFLGFLTSKGG